VKAIGYSVDTVTAAYIVRWLALLIDTLTEEAMNQAIQTRLFDSDRSTDSALDRVHDPDRMRALLRWIRPNAGGKLTTSASEAPIPIPEALVAILTDWNAHGMDAPYGFPMPDSCEWFLPTLGRRAAWTSGQPGGKAIDRLKATAKRAGVEGMTFLSLRHSVATHLEFHGLGAAGISRILRHTTTRTAEKHYRHAGLDNLRSMTAGFDY
jgi:integrase